MFLSPKRDIAAIRKVGRDIGQRYPTIGGVFAISTIVVKWLFVAGAIGLVFLFFLFVVKTLDTKRGEMEWGGQPTPPWLPRRVLDLTCIEPDPRIDEYLQRHGIQATDPEEQRRAYEECLTQKTAEERVYEEARIAREEWRACVERVSIFE